MDFVDALSCSLEANITYPLIFYEGNRPFDATLEVLYHLLGFHQAVQGEIRRCCGKVEQLFDLLYKLISRLHNFPGIHRRITAGV